MTCNDAQAFLAAYLDDELGVADAIRIEQHLATCALCRGARDESLSLRSELAGLAYHAPPELARRVRDRVRLAARKETPGHKRQYWSAAAAALVILAAGLSLLLVMSRPKRSAIEAGIFDAHIRSLQAGHLLDVPSSDRHTVKPWFQGKLDFAPSIPDLAAASGWILQGGRLDYVNGRAVAALVYQRRNHIINVFVSPDHGRGDGTIQSQDNQGYHSLHWNDPEMTYWVISDLNAAELLEFARLLRGR
jgi:anti-sigma factor RsiW